jgi:hypothetical protein
MILVTRLRVVLEQAPQIGIEGVRVALFERDEQDPDDFLMEGVTDGQGEVSFHYDSSLFTDQEDQPLWRAESLPELFVVIYSAKGEILYSTRSEAAPDALRRLILVALPQNLVEKLGD